MNTAKDRLVRIGNVGAWSNRHALADVQALISKISAFPRTKNEQLSMVENGLNEITKSWGAGPVHYALDAIEQKQAQTAASAAPHVPIAKASQRPSQAPSIVVDTSALAKALAPLAVAVSANGARLQKVAKATTTWSLKQAIDLAADAHAGLLKSMTPKRPAFRPGDFNAQLAAEEREARTVRKASKPVPLFKNNIAFAHDLAKEIADEAD